MAEPQSNIKNRIIGISLIALMSFGFYLLYAYAHYANDDYAYLYPFYDYKINGEDLSLGSVLFWITEQVNNNFRLANIMAIFFLLLPRCIVDVLSVIITMLLLWYAMKLLNIKNLMSLSMAMLLVSFVFILPWYDQILYITFRLNYVWSSAFALLFLYLFFDNEHKSIYRKITLIVITIIVSLMHEGIGVPILISLLVQMLVSKDKFCYYKIVLIIILILGIVCLLFTPGMSARISYSLKLRSLFSYIMYLLVYNMPSFVFILVLIVAILKGYFRKIIATKIPFYATATIVGCCIFMVSPVIRASWFPTLFSIMGLIVLFRDIFSVKIKKQKYVSFMLYIITILHIVISCYYVRLIYCQWDLIANKYEDGIGVNFFTPITLEKDIPIVAMGKSYGFRHQQWGNGIMTLMSDFYRIKRGVYAIPEILMFIKKSDLEKVNGNNPFYRVGHFILLPKEHENAIENEYIFNINPIKLMPINISTIPQIEYIEFETNSGIQYYLVAANYQALPSIYDNVESINEIK